MEVKSKHKVLTNFAVDIAKDIDFSGLCNRLIEDIFADNSVNDATCYKSVHLIKRERYIHFFVHSVLLHHLIIYDSIVKNNKVDEFILIGGGKTIDHDQWWQLFSQKAPMYAAKFVCKKNNLKLSVIDKESDIQNTEIGRHNIINKYLLGIFNGVAGFLFNLFHKKKTIFYISVQYRWIERGVFYKIQIQIYSW